MKPLKHINLFFRTTCLSLILVAFLFSPVSIQAQEKLPVKVLRIQFFPLVNGRLDASKTGMNLTYDEIVAKTNSMTQVTEQTLEEGSRYHGYKNTSAPQYLDYQVIDTKEYLTPIPRSNNQIPWNPGWYRPDYNQILTNLNICNYVENLGVKQVWMWGYHYGDIEPSESNMAGPYGDISNGERIADMPVCNKTYVLYNYNYARSTASAVHDHMHQFEIVLGYMDIAEELFWNVFVRPYGHTGGPNNCGWAHKPPNTNISYDYGNTASLTTRCEDWRPDETGTIQSINCTRWGCSEIGFFRWWMQNLPGKDHNLFYQGKLLRNWWDPTYDFDGYLVVGRNLVFQGATPTPSHTPTPNPLSLTPTQTLTPTPPVDMTVPIVNIVSPLANSSVNGIIQISTTATDNIGVISHKILIDNFKPNSGTLLLKECGLVTTCTYDLNIDTMELLPDERPNHFVIVVEARDAGGNLGRKWIEVEAVRGGTPTPTPKPGDVNGDNSVNLTDLSTLLSNFGKTDMARTQGDMDGNSIVNLSDLSILLSNFGK